MSRKPSEKTQLASANREIRALERELTKLRDEMRQYRGRAIQAEQSAAEWKARFDKLLEFRRLSETENGDL